MLHWVNQAGGILLGSRALSPASIFLLPIIHQFQLVPYVQYLPFDLQSVFMNITAENQQVLMGITTPASSLLSLPQLCPSPIPSLEGDQSDLSKQKLTCHPSLNPVLQLP